MDLAQGSRIHQKKLQTSGVSCLFVITSSTSSFQPSSLPLSHVKVPEAPALAVQVLHQKVQSHQAQVAKLVSLTNSKFSGRRSNQRISTARSRLETFQRWSLLGVLGGTKGGSCHDAGMGVLHSGVCDATGNTEFRPGLRAVGKCWDHFIIFFCSQPFNYETFYLRLVLVTCSWEYPITIHRWIRRWDK